MTKAKEMQVYSVQEAYNLGFEDGFHSAHGNIQTKRVYQKRKEIIHCKDCQHCYPFLTGGYFCATVKNFESTTPDGYCAWGVKRDE